MKLLACGGRDFSNVQWAYRILDTIHARNTVTLLIEGGQRGADAAAKCWALDRGIPRVTEDAPWGTFYGNRAGNRRNQLMLDKWQPDAILALPGGRGTADMLERSHLYRKRKLGANARDIRIWDIAQMQRYLANADELTLKEAPA